MEPFVIGLVAFVVCTGALLLTGGTRRLQARTPNRLDSLWVIGVGLSAIPLGMWTVGKSTLGSLVFFGAALVCTILGFLYLLRRN